MTCPCIGEGRLGFRQLIQSFRLLILLDTYISFILISHESLISRTMDPQSRSSPLDQWRRDLFSSGVNDVIPVEIKYTN